MSIADKLVYLDGTKTALADAINIALAARGEPPLDANATFRSYAERLFYPGYLFGQGEQGTYSLPPNPDSYFADTAGTTPAALTDAIALVQGEVGPDWTQGTATARPVWAREPEGGRRNLLTWSEDFSKSVWAKASGVSLATDTTLAPDGSVAPRVDLVGTGHHIQQGVLFSTGVTYTLSVWVKPKTTPFPFLLAYYDGIIALNAAQFTPEAGKWNRLSYTFTPSTLASIPIIRLIGFSNGNVGDSLYIWGAQAEAGSTPTPYQKVTTAADVTEAGVPSVPYVRFDLADDVLTTTLPAATYTVVLPARQGIWFDSVEHAGGSFSIGPTSYTGGPAGILTALESDGVSKLVAMPYVGREPTAGEKAALVQWYQARGAGELLEVLP